MLSIVVAVKICAGGFCNVEVVPLSKFQLYVSPSATPLVFVIVEITGEQPATGVNVNDGVGSGAILMYVVSC